MINVGADYFRGYLKQKGLSERYIKENLYYFLGFTSGYLFNQEGVRKFFTEKRNSNINARSFVKNLKECLLLNYKELQINDEQYKEINEVTLPKQTGRTEIKITIPLNLEQIKLLEENLPTEELKLMLMLSYYCGLRLGELISIKISSFNWGVWKNNPEEMGEVIVLGKGSKQGTAIIPSWLMKRITNFINSKKFKQGIDSKLFSVPARTWEDKLSKAGIVTKITIIDEHGKPVENTRVFPHRCRHSYAHNLLKSGVDIRYIKEALRHSSISSTQIYTYVSKDELKEKLKFINQKR